MLVLLIVFALACFIQLLYFLFVFRKLSFFRDKNPSKGSLPPVSVIICARNEIENLRDNLSLVLKQNYPEFEVVVVNDCSYDESLDFLKELKTSYSHLKIVDIPEHDRYKHGKKFAVTLGIKAASHEYLLFTDADCRPESDQWIRHMQSSFNEDKSIVLGFSPYIKHFSFLNAIIRYETFITGFQYLSFALAGKPYMGVGRNMAYRKELFFANKGFAAHMHIQSGDDDLFVNHVATSRNTAVQLHPDSFVNSIPKYTWMSYFEQKHRHLSTGRHYKKRDKFNLVTLSVTGLLFYLSLILLLAWKVHVPVVLGIFTSRLLIQGFFYYFGMKRLKTFDLWFYFPILDFLYNLMQPFMGFINLFKKNIRWK